MPAKAAVVLAAPLVFATALAFADTPSRSADRAPFVAQAVSKAPVDPLAALIDAANGKEALAASRRALLQSAFFCRGGIDLTTVWIKLTEPGGKAIHVNLEQITSIRSTTQVPGARAQLDFVSGKFQGVQEDVDEVMRLISAAANARERDDDT